MLIVSNLVRENSSCQVLSEHFLICRIIFSMGLVGGSITGVLILKS